jgi:hypothetical protein
MYWSLNKGVNCDQLELGGLHEKHELSTSALILGPVPASV